MVEDYEANMVKKITLNEIFNQMEENNKPKLNPLMEMMMKESKAFRENYKPMSEIEDRYLVSTAQSKDKAEKKDPTINQIMEWMGNQRTDF